MKTRSVLTVCAGLALMLASVGRAEDKPVLRYQPRTDEERPMPVAVFIGPQEGRLALKVVFDRAPWGEECKRRCANSTLFLDLDNNRSTGLQMGKAPETGSDVAITILGVREYSEISADSRLRVKLRQFLTNAERIEEGATFLELDHRRDTDRLKIQDRIVYVLIDIAQVDVPAGKRMRVMLHPAGGNAIQGEAMGMLSPLRVHVFPER